MSNNLKEQTLNTFANHITICKMCDKDLLYLKENLITEFDNFDSAKHTSLYVPSDIFAYDTFVLSINILYIFTLQRFDPTNLQFLKVTLTKLHS